MLILLIFCELGQRMTDAFEEIRSEISAFEWNLFQFEMQKLLPFILAGVQHPVEFKYFGSISLTRGDFKKVSRKL